MCAKRKILPFQVEENGLPLTLSKSRRADGLYSSTMPLVPNPVSIVIRPKQHK